MNEKLPTVTIGCPIRNREKYLPYYLKAIQELNYPSENISLIFVLNDSIDNTKQILYQFKDENSHKYSRIKIDNYDLNTPKDSRDSYTRNNFTYNSLAKLRNYLLYNIKTDYFLSCDSDIMMKPDTLTKLMSHQQDYVAGLIINGYEFDPADPYKYTNILRNSPKGYLHVQNIPDNELIEVDFTGAIMLLSRKAYKSGAQFAPHKLGEDLPFCQGINQHGMNIYCDTSARCTHLMTEELLAKYIKGEFTW